MRYLSTTGGFYLPEIHGDAIPPDAVEITEAEHAALMAAQAQGATIQPGERGYPVAVFPEPPTDADLRDRWRDTACLARADFLKALVRHELLNADDAIAAAKGAWPDAFAAALKNLPVDPIDAQIDWAAATSVARNHPLFAALLAYHAAPTGMRPDAAAALGDAIFGWTDHAAAETTLIEE